jgi:hypothetical protein
MSLAVLLQGTTAEVANSAGGYYGTFWFSLALINAGLAQLQGRRGLNWFLLSILLGPIATLILVLQYKKA